MRFHQGNKKPNPQTFHSFCGLIADILLADTYIIAALVVFVKMISHVGRGGEGTGKAKRLVNGTASFEFALRGLMEL
nr:MAG TPA: hypothetical protein [Caudoviricetes sp.]